MLVALKVIGSINFKIALITIGSINFKISLITIGSINFMSENCDNFLDSLTK